MVFPAFAACTAVRSRSRARRPACTVIVTARTASSSTSMEPAANAPRLRRTSLPRRYEALGGPATTGSLRRWRLTSAASPFAVS